MKRILISCSLCLMLMPNMSVNAGFKENIISHWNDFNEWLQCNSFGCGFTGIAAECVLLAANKSPTTPMQYLRSQRPGCFKKVTPNSTKVCKAVKEYETHDPYAGHPFDSVTACKADITGGKVVSGLHSLKERFTGMFRRKK